MCESLDFRCLQDAGMPQEMIARCTSLLQNRQEQGAAVLLESWRNELLAQLHKSQKQIDCLDYFCRNLKT